jgi:hypothetical protein
MHNVRKISRGRGQDQVGVGARVGEEDEELGLRGWEICLGSFLGEGGSVTIVIVDGRSH